MKTVIASTEDISPTKVYADKVWGADMYISPNSWRLVEGHMVGRVAQVFAGGDIASYVSAGVNVWAVPLAHLEMLESLAGALNIHPFTQAGAGAVVVGLVPAAQVNQVDFFAVQQVLGKPLDAVLMLGDGTETLEDMQPYFEELERQIKFGNLEFYGVFMNQLSHGAWGLEMVLEKATTAAAKVWERRKRSGLRLLGVPLSLTELSALKNPTCVVKTFAGEEKVSLLEMAARVNMSVLAFSTLLLQGDSALLQTELAKRLPPAWQTAPLAEVALGTITSIPAVSCAVVSPAEKCSAINIRAVMRRGDFVDVAKVVGME